MGRLSNGRSTSRTNLASESTRASNTSLAKASVTSSRATSLPPEKPRGTLTKFNEQNRNRIRRRKERRETQLCQVVRVNLKSSEPCKQCCESKKSNHTADQLKGESEQVEFWGITQLSGKLNEPCRVK